MKHNNRLKGHIAENEVAKVWRAAGLTVRGLEASGDHLIVRPERSFGEIADAWVMQDGLRLGLIVLGWDEKQAARAGQMFRDWLATPKPLHMEVKRQERVRMPEWVEQTNRDAPPGTIPVLCWRTNRMKWRGDLDLDALAELAS